MADYHKIADSRSRMRGAYGKGNESSLAYGRKWRWGGWLLGLSAVLVGVGAFLLLAVYGPVVMVEAKYQIQSVSRALGVEDRGLIGLMVPDFSYDLMAMELGDGYGLVIPKIFIKELVVLNVDPVDKNIYMPALSKGIAHAAGTALPGEGGLGYYFAHSSGIGGLNTGFRAKFYLLGKLELGDEVLLYQNKKKYEYVVADKRVTSADDVSFLNNHDGKDVVVLQTCWPVGTSARRLVVTAERV